MMKHESSPAASTRLAACIVVLMVSGCGGSTKSDAATSGGGSGGLAAGTGGTPGISGGSGGAGGGVGGSGGGVGGSGGTVSSKPCGCEQGQACGPNEWCDFEAKDYCGSGDACGVCRPRPDPSACPPPPPMGCMGECGCGQPFTTCGCDGQFYCSPDCAHLAGTDDNPSCDMSPPSGLCKDIDQALAGQLTSVHCSSVVRLEFEGLYAKSYSILCGSGPAPDEPTARAAAQADTGFGQGQLLSGPNPKDEYVFWSAPGDFGGASAVSAISGQTVFGGSIVWMGVGEIDYPNLWNPATKLGYCGGTPPPNPPSRAFDLSGGQTGDYEAAAQAALSTVMATELPNGISLAGHQIVSAVELLYPRTVGAFDPSTAEWIVILNSSALNQ